MVSAINFAVRSGAGGTQNGSVAGEGQGNFIQVHSGDSVSLNLSRNSIVAYEQQGGDLLIKLTDGRAIVLDGYFEEAAGDKNHLYLSSDGQIVEVFVDDTGNGVLYADYGPVQGWDKWSPLDDLRYTSADPIGEMAAASSEPAGMGPIVPGLLGGLGGAAAVAGGAAIIGGGGGSKGHRNPTVDSQPTTTVTTNTENPHLTVTGTGQAGETVVVTIGNQTQTTTIGNNGTWSTSFPSTGLPPDGTYTASVVVTGDHGSHPTLTGPNFVIDLTPPPVSVVHGTQSTGDVENLAEYQDGVSLSGKSEAGATITVQVGSHTQTTTVSATGDWSVTFTQSQIAAGEYSIPAVITATDPLGNKTVLNEVIVIDTVPNTITFNSVTSDNTVNLTESQGILTVTGTATAGATLQVTLQGVTRTVTASSSGTWSTTYDANLLPGGEYGATITATSTDAAGNSSSASHTFRVDTLTNVAFTGTVAGDNVINAAESHGSVVLTGTAQAGATVSVAWNGTTLPATVAADGTWSVSFPASSIPSGTLSTTATVTATDAAGNTATATRTIAIDTEISVGIDARQVGGDNIISGAEQKAGIALTGTAEAGSKVVVVFEGATRTVTAGSNGTWTANFAASEIPTGTRTGTVQVTATDAAGNTATATSTINIDTEVTPFSRSTLSTGSDTILNFEEAKSGLTVTGKVEAGSSVLVTFGNGSSLPATVAADGSWTVKIPASQIPAGENSVKLTAVATDAVGNTSTITENVAVDTVVRNFALTGGKIGGDGILNAAEVAQGLTMTGSAEPGATLVLHLTNGAERTVTVGADGNWSATFPASVLPTGELSQTVTITATDRAGNVSTLTDSFLVDTIAPESPEVTGVNKATNGTMRGIYTEDTSDSYSFHEVASNGTSSSVTATRSDMGDEAYFSFGRAVPDGSYLVINTEDAAHNSTSTLVIVNNTTASVVDLSRSGLSNFDFSTIDLTLAPDAQLSITEAQLRNLTGPDHQLVIRGDVDDTVNIVGGVDTHQTQVIDGETYHLYTLGTGASLLIDDDIRTHLTTGV